MIGISEHRKIADRIFPIPIHCTNFVEVRRVTRKGGWATGDKILLAHL